MPDSWNTAVTHIEPNHVRVRGYDIAELMGRLSFGATVYLILRGELPGDNVARLMDAILVSSIDHGATPPSVLACRTVASTGGSLSQAVGAGILSINRYHGGAIESCVLQLRTIIERSETLALSLDEAAEGELADMKLRGERMSGLGHRVHTLDPRTARLFELAQAAGVVGQQGVHVEAIQAVERALAKTGKNLPINVDGAMGAILADLGFPTEVMNGLFMIARVPGLIAHATEEQSREKPMRKIDPANHAYDGPGPRDAPD